MLLTQLEHIEAMQNCYMNLQDDQPKSKQLTDISRAVVKQLKILRDQKEEFVQARHRLLPRLMIGAMTA